jgi:hypothetical protein
LVSQSPPTPPRDMSWWVSRFRRDSRAVVDTLPRVAKLAAGGTTIIPGALDRVRNGTANGMGRARSSGNVQGVYDNPSIVAKDIHLPPDEAHGATGTQIISGIIRSEEYNEDLEGEKGLWVFRRMWLSDGEVSALMQVLMLPLLEATWSVEAASKDQQDVDIAQFVQDNLFDGMQRTWHETLEFILLSWLRDGSAWLEKVWVNSPDGKIRLRKLAPRLTRSIYRTYPGSDDELDRIQQRVWKNSDDGIGGSYIYPVIPADKLVIFTNMQEGNNWRGVSVLRAAYKHWYFKDMLEKIAAVAADRMAVGVPWMQEPPGNTAQKSDRDNAANVMASLHANEKAYVLTPNGWTFDFVTPKTGMNILPYIEYHSLQIVRSVLAQFLNLDRGGSYALSMDISSFFLQALHARARYIRDVFNRSVIRPLVDQNFKVDRYPMLQVKDLDKRDVAKFMAGLAQILAANWLTHDADTENAIRSILDLPDLDPSALPIGGGQPTVDTDTMGKPATVEGVEGMQALPKAAPGPAGVRGKSSTGPDGVRLPGPAEAPSEAQYSRVGEFEPAMWQAITEVLPDRPDSVDPRRWRETVLNQARLMAVGATVREAQLAGNAGNPEALREWFEAGADGAIDWGSPGDFEQCVAVAGKYMDDPEGYCNLRHQAAVGGPPGSEDK